MTVSANLQWNLPIILKVELDSLSLVIALVIAACLAYSKSCPLQM